MKIINKVLSNENQMILSLLQIIAGSLIIALFAQFRFPLYFTPLISISVNGQTFAVLLVGALLGSRKGTLAVLAYLLEGSFNLPVFSGGAFGVHYLFSHTGGYLMGFILQAFLIGRFFEIKENCHFMTAFSALIVVSVIHLFIGALWLSLFVGFSNMLAFGFYPFLIPACFKAFAVTGILKIKSKIA